MRRFGMLGLIFCLMFLKQELQGQHYETVYFKADSGIYIRFMGNPTRYFYQTPLGDITIYEYKPEANMNDSNCLYAIAIYKTPAGETSTNHLTDLQTDARFNEIVNADEMAVNNLSGKIFSKGEVVYEGLRGIRMKVLFSDLSELNEIEGQKNIEYNAIYFKHKNKVIKLWIYTPVGKENKKIDYFFNSLSCSQN